ncbi:DUF1642 domain-containing protein [Streptococcus intermedius]|uniref:DUF1642 domain-containing protein n=1 Tax=Streptococcus intermedius TaxID=1338 RepID=UPI00069D5319|nr:DUF1642 domain-containing protein [Streptococcus intermedius]
MDRRDLKEGQEVYVKGRVIHTGDHLDIVLDKGSFIENAIILHHEKPVIPQFVADWIEVCKEHLTTSLYTAMNPNFMKGNSQSFDLILWIKKTSNQDIFARAWLDGYEVEKEKRYRIKMKNEEYNHTVVIGDYTREEIEATGFGWVFDCEDVEVQEVE